MPKSYFLSIGECMIELSGADPDLWRMGYAGDTLNAAWYARALLDRTSWDIGYFTRLGTDGFSDRIVAFLERHGIATDLISRDPRRRPGLYMIEVKDGERHFTYWREASAARLLADDEARLKDAIGSADLVYFSGITLAILAPERRARLIELVGAATAAGKRTAFDPNIRPGLWESPDALRATITRAAGAVEIVLPSFDDEARAFGDADKQATCARYLAAGAREVVVKDGERPALVATTGGLTEVAGIAADRVVDTTGAGDSFAGSYLAARLTGAAPVEAARAGHRIAARVVAHRGALMPMSAVVAPGT